MARFTHDPDGIRLPIKLDTTSNGEFVPIPLSATDKLANRLAHAAASANARRLGVGRRRFLVSACGAASTLLAFNAAHAGNNVGGAGGFFEVDQVAALDADAAAEQLGGREFVFDVQGHFVGANGANHPLGGPEQFIQDVFLDSDTDMMVLSFVPSRRERELLTIQEADATRQVIEQLDGTQRLLLHGRVNPNQDGDLDGMDELAGFGVSAWKTYTQWGPDRRGYFLTDDLGLAFIEKARALGIKNICIHKGLPFGRRSYEHSLCSDVGPAAAMFPDVNFLIYHSGFISSEAEGPYDAGRGEGVDELIRSVEAAGIGKGSNVYAELGSTWRATATRAPEMAAHIIGKLVKHLGEDNVLYGSDSIWFGSPQDQIQAMRTFQISEALQAAHGYPAMTPGLRAKILGLNAARVYGIEVDEVLQRARADGVSQQRHAYRQEPDPHFLTYGPRSRREFLLNRKARGDVV